MTNRTKLFLGISSSFIFIILLVYSIDIKGTFEQIRHFDKSSLFFILIIYFIVMFLRSLRWKMILEQRVNIPLYNTYQYLTLGYFFNSILPLKGGEVIRAEYLKRYQNCSRSFTFGTIFVERLFDFVIVIIFLTISVIFSETIQRLFDLKIMTLILVTIIAIFTFIYFNFSRIYTRFNVFIPSKYRVHISSILKRFKTSFNLFKEIKALVSISVMSVFIWLFTLSITVITIQSLSIDIPIYAYLFVVSAGVIGMVIPSSSSNIGVYHAIAVGALLLFGVPAELALSYAIIVHAMEFIPNVTLGSIFYFLKLKKL